VNKQKLLEIIGNYHNISSKDLEALEELVKEYPYFQGARSLIAKGSHLNNTASKDMKIRLAALFATNRSVLKRLMEGKISSSSFSGSIPTPTEKSSPTETVSKQAVPTTKTSLAAKESVTTPPASKKPVVKDQIPNKEEEVVKDLPQTSNKPEQPATIPAEEEKPATPTPPSPAKEDQAATSNAPTIDLEQLYQEIEQNLKELQIHKKKFFQGEGAEPTDEKKKPQIVEEDFLKTIEKKEEIIAEDANKKEQIKLIDDFIKTAPSFSQKKTPPTEQPQEQVDLSEKSILKDDNFISENLANIMLKQGKKEKALDIYKKLIWKFPQKKSYFASLIEEIKREE